MRATVRKTMMGKTTLMTPGSSPDSYSMTILRSFSEVSLERILWRRGTRAM
jgi:hypothetical protein